MSKYTEPVTMWITPKQKQRLKRAARKIGTKISTMMRETVSNKVERVLRSDDGDK